MDCHISFNNTWMRIFRDQELFKHRAPFPDILCLQERMNWDKSQYDFGHYGVSCLEGRKNYKARYPIMLTPRVEKIQSI